MDAGLETLLLQNRSNVEQDVLMLTRFCCGYITERGAAAFRASAEPLTRNILQNPDLLPVLHLSDSTQGIKPPIIDAKPAVS